MALTYKGGIKRFVLKKKQSLSLQSQSNAFTAVQGLISRLIYFPKNTNLEEITNFLLQKYWIIVPFSPQTFKTKPILYLVNFIFNLSLEILIKWSNMSNEMQGKRLLRKIF